MVKGRMAGYFPGVVTKHRNRGTRTNQGVPMKTYDNKIILALLFVATLLAIASSGCNTAHGFGKDMENAGDKIQEKTQ